LLDELERLTSAMSSMSKRIALRASTREMILPGELNASFQVRVMSPFD
jgi:hypothetical protein